MNETVEKFLKDIQIDYCWLLYSHEYIDTRVCPDPEYAKYMRADFPFCCGVASQIIASFLSAHFQKTTCYMTRNLRFNHSWCECQGTIIDYTYFQFNLSPEMRSKFKEYKVDRKEFEIFLERIPVIQEPQDHMATCDWIQRYEIELQTVNKAKKYPFSKDGLLSYAEDVFDEIQLNTNYQ